MIISSRLSYNQRKGFNKNTTSLHINLRLTFDSDFISV